MVPTIFLLTILVSAVISADIEGSVDWVNDNMAAVDDQLGCGSCYGFAAAASMEWKTSNITGTLNKLSRQFYIDCMGYDGCGGGLPSDAFKYAMAYQYHPYDADYDYTGYYDEDMCDEVGGSDQSLRNALADVWFLDYARLAKNDWQYMESSVMQNGPVVATGYISTSFQGYWYNDGDAPYTDSTCLDEPTSHVMLITGYNYNDGNPYITFRNSYSEYWGNGGYIDYYTNDENYGCDFTSQAYQIYLSKRREIEYKIGSGRKNFYDAQDYCQSLDSGTSTGWDLAIVPTRMHNMEVFDMFTDSYGTSKKNNDNFNYFWIGIDTAKTSYTWVDGSDIIYSNWDYGQDFSYKFTAMYKYNTDYEDEDARGKWATFSKLEEFRFMCSRYRSESCERISQTAVENAYSFTMYDADGNETLEIEEGTTGSFTCMDGYTLYGDSVTCENGSWSTLPTCSMAA